MVDLKALISEARPEFFEQAACKNLDTAQFFGTEPSKTARAACARCPVVDECLAYSLQSGSYDFGFWGGKTPKERRELRSGLGLTANAMKKAKRRAKIERARAMRESGVPLREVAKAFDTTYARMVAWLNEDPIE